MIKFLEGLVKVLYKFRTRLFLGLTALVNGMVELVENLYHWILEVIQSIWRYLIRFCIAFVNLTWVFIQLILLYMPTIGMVLYYNYQEPYWGWLAGAIVWALVVTLAGLFYRENP